jgi:hypothetical protein
MHPHRMTDHLPLSGWKISRRGHVFSLTDSMEQSLWEAGNFSAGQAILRHSHPHPLISLRSSLILSFYAYPRWRLVSGLPAGNADSTQRDFFVGRPTRWKRVGTMTHLGPILLLCLEMLIFSTINEYFKCGEVELWRLLPYAAWRENWKRA